MEQRTSSGVRVLGGVSALLLGVVLIWAGISVGVNEGESGGPFILVGTCLIVLTIVVMCVTAVGDSIRQRR